MCYNTQTRNLLGTNKTFVTDIMKLSDIMIINKDDYLKIRKYIKALCLDSVKELCEQVGFDDFDTTLIIHTNQDKTRVYTSIELGICESAVSKRKNKLFLKIRDYLKRNNIQY